MIELLNSLKNRGMVTNYYITPHHKKILGNILYLKKLTPELKSNNFDVFLSASEMQPNERYLMECVLSACCISVMMWHNITFLFMYHKSYIQQLLAGEKIPKSSPIRVNSKLVSLSFFQKSQLLIKKIINKRNSLFSYHAIHIIYGFIYNKVIFWMRWMLRTKKRFWMRWIRWMIRTKKRINQLKARIIYPFLLTGKNFQLRAYDQITQLGSGRSDAIIFFDELEVKVHKLLFKNLKVYAAQFPSSGSCKCYSSPNKKDTILSPLSNWVHSQQIPESVLKLYSRDYQTVIRNTSSSRIDLRLHPDESGMWPYQLCDYLCEQGIDARICKPDLPLRKIVCDYLGVVGSASASLRDCRAVCDYAFVVGFVGVSSQFQDPKFVFANSEGIGWINEDGSYDPNIFQREKFVPPKRKSVPEILNELSLKQDSKIV